MRIADRIRFRGTAFAVVLTFLTVSPAATAEALNSIVLRVNDEISTLYDYEERRDARLAAIAESKTLPPEERRKFVEEAPRATMREILDELLLLSRARQLVIEPGPTEIDEMMDASRQRMGIPDEEAFRAALEASHMTIADYRDRTARSIKINQVIQREVNPRVVVPDEWLQRYYREHPEEFRIPAKARLREVVIASEKVGAEEAARLGSALRDAIAGGEEMTAAVERLRGPAPDSIVGPVDLGWMQPGELAPALDKAVWSLPPGALSPPIEARGGLHLVEVQERVESSMRPFTEIKDELEEREKENRRDNELRKFLGDLEKKAYLLEKIPAEAAGFRDVEAAAENDPLAAFAPNRGQRTGPPPIESAPPLAPIPAPKPSSEQPDDNP